MEDENAGRSRERSTRRELARWSRAILAAIVQASETPSEQENQQDQQNQTCAAARVVSPTRAIRPRWQRSNDDENQENDENEAHVASSFYGEAPRRAAREPPAGPLTLDEPSLARGLDGLSTRPA